MDGNDYRWAHKSIQEYFVAEFICRNKNKEDILKAMYTSTKVHKYQNIFDIYYDIDYKTFKKVILFEFSKNFLDYCDNSYIDIKKNKQINLEEIRKRQELCYEKYYLLIKERYFNELLKTHKNNESFVFINDIIPLLEEFISNPKISNPRYTFSRYST